MLYNNLSSHCTKTQNTQLVPSYIRSLPALPRGKPGDLACGETFTRKERGAAPPSPWEDSGGQASFCNTRTLLFLFLLFQPSINHLPFPFPLVSPLPPRLSRSMPPLPYLTLYLPHHHHIPSHPSSPPLRMYLGYEGHAKAMYPPQA